MVLETLQQGKCVVHEILPRLHMPKLLQDAKINESKSEQILAVKLKISPVQSRLDNNEDVCLKAYLTDPGSNTNSALQYLQRASHGYRTASYLCVRADD